MKRFSAFLFVAPLCIAPLTVGAAQQVSDSVSLTSARPVPASSSATTPVSGPRLAPQFQRVEPTLAPRSSSGTSALAPDDEGRSHTFVFSTLALVLMAVIIVLLIR